MGNGNLAAFLRTAAAATLALSLAACGGSGGSDRRQGTAPENSAPVIVTPAAVNGVSGGLVTLNGSGSSDPDGDGLSFGWAQVSGTPVSLSGADTAIATFTAPTVTESTTLQFRFTVTDARGSVTTRNVSVQISPTPAPANRIPTATITGPSAVTSGGAVVLNGGTSSDPDGDHLSYAWTQIAGPTVTLGGADTAIASFAAPTVDAATTLRFRLTVDDGRGGTAASEFPVQVNPAAAPANRLPTAAISGPATVVAGAPATLDGSGSSDPDGDTLSYIWTQVSGPGVTLSASNTPAVTFIAPAVETNSNLRFRLAVSDGEGGTDSREISVQVTPADDEEENNRAPVAQVSAPAQVTSGVVVTLDGSASSDPDGDSLAFSWTQVSGPTVTLGGSATAVATFTAPTVTTPTPLQFRLTVSDDRGGDDDAVVSVQVDPAPAPVANAGPDQTVPPGAAVTLDGSGSAGPIAQYVWEQVSGPDVSLSGATTVQAQFTAPDVEAPTTLQFRLTVEDAEGSTSDSDLVDILVDNRQPTLVCTQAGGGVDVVLVLDRSGSMSGAKITQTKAAANRLVNSLGSAARSALVSFDSSATLSKTLSSDHAATAAAVDALTAGGGTNATPAFQMASQLLVDNARQGVRQVIVFLTDGDSNADAASADAKALGIEIFAIGFGISSNAEQQIRTQVSPPEDRHYFSAQDEQGLIDAFDAITGALSSPLIAYSRGIALHATGLLALDDSGLRQINRLEFLVNDQDPDNNIAGGSASTLPLSLPGLLEVGVANSAANGVLNEDRSQITVTGQTSLASVEIHLAGIGVLTVGAVNALSRTTASEDGFVTEGDVGTDVAQLSLLDSALPPIQLLPNVPIVLPGLLELVIEERLETRSDTHAGITVNGLRLKLLGDGLLGELIIGQASSGVACSDSSPFEEAPEEEEETLP